MVTRAMSVIGREGLRAFAPLTRDVECPELSGSVRVRRLSAREAALISNISVQTAKAENASLHVVAMIAEMIYMAWVDENGVQVAADGDKAAIMEWPFVVLDRLADAIRDLSGMDANATEDAAKN